MRKKGKRERKSRRQRRREGDRNKGSGEENDLLVHREKQNRI